MFTPFRFRHTLALVAAAILFASGGCTSLQEYVHNGFKVGPNYAKPDAPVKDHWIDEADKEAHIRVQRGEDLSRWWAVFNDPKLDHLIHRAYRQNLTLKQVAFQVLAARAQLAIAKGNLFPQNQTYGGSFYRYASPSAPPIPATFFDQWAHGFTLNWELDFWGHLRRNIAAKDASLDASVENYDAVLVTLLGDVATNYANARTLQKRIELYKENVTLQRGVFRFIELRNEQGYKVNDLDVNQALGNLRQIEAVIPALEIQLRQTENALCTLLGMPPEDLQEILGTGPIPTAPPDVVVDVPADLLRRRPDIRAAERNAAAQAEQIGIAQAQLYPTLSLNGNLGYVANSFPDLFTPSALSGSVGPGCTWAILNYGRIINNVRYQDTVFQQLAAAYQQSVLVGQQEVENGMISFLRSQRQAKLLDESVDAAKKAVNIVIFQYKVGTADFNRYATIAQALVGQQDSDAQAHGSIATGLITVYRALGGGWEIRLGDGKAEPAAPAATVEEAGPAKPGEGKEPGKLKEVPFPAEGAGVPKEDAPALPEELPKPRRDAVTPPDDVSEPSLPTPPAGEKSTSNETRRQLNPLRSS